MCKKLSIYCDLRSIGWVVGQGESIIKTGIKRVNIDFDTYYEFIAGNAISKRTNRRVKRSARRNKDRRLSRKENLFEFLDKIDMMPTKEMLRTRKTDRLKLCEKSLSEKIGKKELGLVFIEMSKKRGYKSMRGVMGDGSEYLDNIKMHEENSKGFQSVFSYLLSLGTCKDVIFTRERYEETFDQICDRQEIDPSVSAKLKRIIYFQRPLRKGAISSCKLEPKVKVSHKSHPNYQEFRCYRDANNIEIADPMMKQVDIPYEIRKKWAESLLSGKGLTKASCCKDLGIKKSTGYSWLSGKKLHPNVINVLSVYVEKNQSHSTFDLWHDLYSATDEIKLSRLLCNKYGFDDEEIEKLLDLDFKGLGWGEFSQRAIKRLTPHLKKGLKLKEAILNEYGTVDTSSDITLRNLLVEQVFESCKSLVEAIRNELGFDVLQIEINQSLKQSNKSRKQKQSRKRRQVKWEAENKQKIIDAGAEPTHYNYHKLNLWELWQGKSPYQPDVDISLEDLFSEKYNIDHIVPKSKIMERGFVNQCLCTKEMNQKKDQMTGIEFVRYLGVEAGYIEFIEGLKISDKTRKLLFMKSEEIPEDYVSSISGSDYNTRCFMTMHENSTCIPNKIVNRYYREWNVDNYDQDDARSSLMKAYVVANMSKETIDYFDKLNLLPEKSIGRYELKPKLEHICEMPNIYVPSLKLYRKINGKYSPRVQLHKGTVYGHRPKTVIDKKGRRTVVDYYKVRKPIIALTRPMFSKIMDKKMSELINKRFNECGSMDDFFESIEKTPITFNGKKVNSVSVEVKSDSVIPLHSTDGNGNTHPKKDHDRKIDFVYSSQSAMLCLTDGKYHTLPVLEYINSLNNGEKSKYKRVFKKNDIVLFNGEMYYVSGIFEGGVDIRPVHQLSATNQIKCSKSKIDEFVKISVNQLGEITMEETKQTEQKTLFDEN